MYKNRVFNFVSIYIASPGKVNCVFPSGSDRPLTIPMEVSSLLL